jgi:hypothetical protein
MARWLVRTGKSNIGVLSAAYCVLRTAYCEGGLLEVRGPRSELRAPRRLALVRRGPEPVGVPGGRVTTGTRKKGGAQGRCARRALHPREATANRQPLTVDRRPQTVDRRP